MSGTRLAGDLAARPRRGFDDGGGGAGRRRQPGHPVPGGKRRVPAADELRGEGCAAFPAPISSVASTDCSPSCFPHAQERHPAPGANSSPPPGECWTATARRRRCEGEVATARSYGSRGEHTRGIPANADRAGGEAVMRTLRAAAFGLAEGVRLYLRAARSAPSDSGELQQQAWPVGAELARGVESGHA
jgi:hypothetical protein